MKLILKFIQFTFKTLASIFSKIGANYTYTKLWKYFMKYKILFIIYKPLKYLFTNFIYFIKLSSAILAIFSLFNLSIIYYDYDILNEINILVNKVIKYIRLLWFKWFSNEDIEDIEDPIDFFQYKKEAKAIDKVVNQSPNNSYWIIPLMLAIPILFYYFNPQTNINEIIEPVINPIIEKVEEYLPKEYATVFISGTIIYKFIIISISNITGYDLNIFTDDNPKPDDSKFTSGIVSEYKKDLQELLNKRENNYSPIDKLSSEEKEEYESLFGKEDNLETPKASSSKLPETISDKPEILMIENPYKKIGKYDKSIIDSTKVKTEDWN